MYGSNNSDSEVNARVRMVVFKYALGTTAFWKIPYALHNEKQKLYTCAPRDWRNKLQDIGFTAPRLLNDLKWVSRQIKFLSAAFRVALRMA